MSERDLTESAEQAIPCSPEAEAGVLGCCLLENGCIDSCQERKVTVHWFHDLRHALVWKAILDLHNGGAPCDVITLGDQLQKNSTLDQVGGYSFILLLPNSVPSAANLDWYLALLCENYLLRRMLEACRETMADAYHGEETVGKLLARAETRFIKLAEGGTEQPGKPIKPVMQVLVDKAERYHRGGAQMTGAINTGLSYMDKLLCGIGGENGNFFAIAGRPGTGKTALAAQICHYVACDYEWWEETGAKNERGEAVKVKRKGLPVGVFSMEMAAEPFVKRMWFSRAGADMQRWRTGFAVNDDLVRLTKAASELAAAKIIVDDESNLTIDVMRSRARRMHRNGVRLFMVDYIQLMQPSKRSREQNRAYELEDISHGLQALGKELNCPILVLAQMNRDVEKREGKNKLPQLADLKDSGAIEQDADAVLFLYRPKWDEDEEAAWKDEKDGPGGVWVAQERVRCGAKPGQGNWILPPMPVNAYLAKYRYGPSAKDIELVFFGGATRFEDLGDFCKRMGVREKSKGDRRADKTEGEGE